jgi:hypothetical protein
MYSELQIKMVYVDFVKLLSFSNHYSTLRIEGLFPSEISVTLYQTA